MEDLVRIIRHERWSSVDQLIHEDAESIPVDGVRVALVLDNFRSNILWCTAERVGPLMLVHGLNEAKVGKFDVPIIGQQDILGFQISEDHILPKSKHSPSRESVLNIDACADQSHSNAVWGRGGSGNMHASRL